MEISEHFRFSCGETASEIVFELLAKRLGFRELLHFAHGLLMEGTHLVGDGANV